ncbi:hypothetical protein I6F09_20790 [Bradyrhizobium sp. IC3195]|uniref:hypothetical protein n=1 Tax=Bradyrhizobium sp. IC3195 TaxID=2793804 RepID=UPI001CD26D78|nr:hypothetical protein [Bradyrhizobium sp. IC3195]MCA1470329.1 hypothetical protein [Bradyrhizobium sp. IC3195]
MQANYVENDERARTNTAARAREIRYAHRAHQIDGAQVKAMARKRSGETNNSGMVSVYLPTDWVQGGFGADLRQEMYDSLRGRTIPEDLIEAASGCSYHSEIVWHVPPQPGEDVQDDHYDVLHLTGLDAETGERLAQTWAEPRTAGEALAFCLSQELKALKETGNSPVRSGGRLAYSTIAYIAFDLLQGYTVAPPGPYLQKLIQGLLKLSTAAEEQVSTYVSKEKAAYILAQAPHLGLGFIASVVDVDRTTVSRWTKEQKFKARISQLREFMKSPGWTRMIQREGTLQCIEVPHHVEK